MAIIYLGHRLFHRARATDDGETRKSRAELRLPQKKKKNNKKTPQKKGKKRYIGTYPSGSRGISTNISFSLTKHTDGPYIEQSTKSKKKRKKKKIRKKEKPKHPLKIKIETNTRRAIEAHNECKTAQTRGSPPLHPVKLTLRDTETHFTQKHTNKKTAKKKKKKGSRHASP